MGAWLEYAKLFAMLLPMVMDLIRSVEAILPQSGAGPQKLQLVLATLEASHQLAGVATSEWDKMKPSVTSIINSSVAVFNSLKVFSK